MKALTVWLPWASLIAMGAKPYEFRSWKPPPAIIGQRIAIHAGAHKITKSEILDALRPGDKSYGLRMDIVEGWLRNLLASLENNDSSPRAAKALHDKLSLPLSAIICTVIIGEPQSRANCLREFGVDISLSEAAQPPDRYSVVRKTASLLQSQKIKTQERQMQEIEKRGIEKQGIEKIARPAKSVEGQGANMFRWGWPMLDVQPIDPPLPARGAQGIWNWTPSAP